MKGWDRAPYTIWSRLGSQLPCGPSPNSGSPQPVVVVNGWTYAPAESRSFAKRPGSRLGFQVPVPWVVLSCHVCGNFLSIRAHHGPRCISAALISGEISVLDWVTTRRTRHVQRPKRKKTSWRQGPVKNILLMLVTGHRNDCKRLTSLRTAIQDDHTFHAAVSYARQAIHASRFKGTVSTCVFPISPRPSLGCAHCVWVTT